MKNVIVLISLLLFRISITNGQTVVIKGSVRNAQGYGLPFVFVENKNVQSAIYTDSAGNFSINASPQDVLQFSVKGYNDTMVIVKNSNILLITLSSLQRNENRASGTTQSGQPNVTVSDAFSGHTYLNNNVNSSGSGVAGGGELEFNSGFFPLSKEKEETHGSRYLYKDWKQGVVVNSKGTEINNPSYFYNYDKSDGDLLLSHDKQNAIILNKDQIKSFSIYGDANATDNFQIVPAIDNNKFVQVLSDGSKYKIYKLTKTKIVKANYSTNGIVSSGNPYDEYIDDNAYFVLNVSTNHLDKFMLKKKAIRGAFIQEGNKVNSFFDAQGDDVIDDNLLKGLGSYLDK